MRRSSIRRQIRNKKSNRMGNCLHLKRREQFFCRQENVKLRKRIINYPQPQKLFVYLPPTKLTTKKFSDPTENPLSVDVEADENKWKVVNEREAINICQCLSSIIGSLRHRTCEISFVGSRWDHVPACLFF